MLRNKINKKGKMEWEYLAAIVLILIIIVVMLLFSQGIKTKVMEKGSEFFSKIIPDWLGQ
ncbi:MAG: hypothetical protein Q8O03_06095 [Nanoarchaeota archaeon]|jgi:uncharacterized membrane protein YvbJ|nr:hypothetical protein [Nanoarchaeota archaeon]